MDWAERLHFDWVGGIGCTFRGSGQFIIRATLDRSGRATFHRSDGKEASFQASGEAEASSRVQSVSWLPAADGLVAETVTGDHIAFELASFCGGDQLDGRLIVYLDQNQWSLPGASASSRSVTFASLAASFSSVTASQYRRRPSSVQTARHRPPASGLLRRVHGDARVELDHRPAAG